MSISWWKWFARSHWQGRGEGGGRLIKSQFDVEVIDECKLVEMICAQPPLDVCGIVKNCCCHCLHYGLLRGGGERAGRMRCWRLLRWTVMTITMATVWAKKGLDKGEGEGESKDGFVFSCCHILLLFFGLPFSMQVDWFLIKIKSIVRWASLARFLFWLSKFGHHISL